MIELQNLSKQYDRFLAVDNLNLTIGDGEFFGLLGPNGAGKTTTISMLSTLLLPTTGTIWINGELLTRKNDRLKRKLSVSQWQNRPPTQQQSPHSLQYWSVLQ